jgi:peptide/nickel transport system permease protein
MNEIILDQTGGTKIKGWKLLKRRFVMNRMAACGLIVFFIFLFMSLFPSLIAPRDPFYQDLSVRFTPAFILKGGTAKHILGTDQLGRDILSRIIFGARISIFVAFSSVLFSLVIGVPLGLISGYFGGTTDTVLMRIVDTMLAFPAFVLVLVTVAILGPSVWNMAMVIGFVGWASYARLVRGQVLSIRENQYIEACKCIGVGSIRTMFIHVLPNIISPLIVFATFHVARVILIEAALSFLGLGVQPPTASWGIMLSEGRQHIYRSMWVSIFPGMAIIILVLSLNFIGDGIRDAMDVEMTL